ncbi:MAG: hypothetical protein AAB922_03430 [Patescibacteria group bacterium]
MKTRKAMQGEYIRGGKRCWCDALWDSYMIDWALVHREWIDTLPEDVIGGRESFRRFVDFIMDNNWQHSWYRSRRIDKLKEICSPYFFETQYKEGT